MVFLYNAAIWLGGLFYRVAAILGRPKARKWLKGQQSVFAELEKSGAGKSKCVWFHFASLGEFEQGRPVLEGIRKEYPASRIVVSFFSPSGYEVRKNYAGADQVVYLPLDTPAGARRFIELIDPACAIFTKYEYWYHYYRELKKREIPLFVIASIFRREQVFFKWYGGFFRKILACVTCFFVQNEESAALLESIGFSNYRLSGDPRYDRVWDNARRPASFPEITRFLAGAPCMVAGSTWPDDEKLLIRYLKQHKGWKYLIAPHEVAESHVRELRALLGEDGISYSEWINTSARADAPKVLIIDRIGMLASLYRYGQIAYIGGGFGKGIHNILEAAVFGMPVLFGPNYKRFGEAHALIGAGCAFPVSNYHDLSAKLLELQGDEELRKGLSETARSSVAAGRGATPLILAEIRKLFR